MNNIRVLREKCGLTQGQLAEKLGLALDTVSRYENDKREPRASDLVRMAEIFKCTVDEIINPPHLHPERAAQGMEERKPQE